MRRPYKVAAIVLSALGLMMGGLVLNANQAYAYTVNNDLSAYGDVVLDSGTYTLMGGDAINVGNTGPYQALYGQTLHAALEQAYVSDGKGNWGIMLADMKGANANNGYLLVADSSKSSNAQTWVQRLGGNWSFVQNYLQTQNQQIQTYDQQNQTSYTYVPFATIVSESGAIFGTKQIGGPNGTYTDPSTRQTYNEYMYTYPIETSNPPVTTGLTVSDASTGSQTVTQGDPIQFGASSNVYLFSQLSGGANGHHYDAVELTNQSTGQTYWAVGSGSTDMTTMQAVSGGNGVFSDTLQFNTSGLQSGTYTASLWVADAVDRVSATPATTTFTVTPGSDGPSVMLTANAINLTAGQASTLAASANNGPNGDYIKIIDETGAQTLSGSNTYADSQAGESALTASAMDNQAQQVTYVAELVNASTGKVDATSNSVQVTWTSVAPSIKVTASPTTMGPGQSTQITYQATGLQSGDFVNVFGSGTGASNIWSAYNQISSVGTGTEAENPGQGQTISVTYDAWVYNSSGQGIAHDSITVTWTNNWTGTVSLIASPTLVQARHATTLTATTSQALPSGYVLMIVDETTGQIVGAGTSSPFASQYTSWGAETDKFVAYVSAGGSAAGPLSNVVTVQWSQVGVSASPTNLPMNSQSTISATAQNMPFGYYLVLYDQTTGQVIGSTTSSNLSATQTKTAAETDTYVAYLSSTATPANAIATSLSVAIDWYGVTLTASPISLPSGTATTLTANAVNVPSGYALYIMNKTTGKVVAVGTTGQTTLTATETKAAAETDTYVAEIGVPSNSGTIYLAEVHYTDDFPQETGQIYSIQDKPQNDLSSGTQWTSLGNPNAAMEPYTLGYDQNTQTLYSGEVSTQDQGTSSNSIIQITGGQAYYQVSGTTTWTPINLPGIATYMIYNQVSKKFFIAMHNGGTYGLYVADPTTPGQFTLVSTQGTQFQISVDPSTGDMYAAAGVPLTMNTAPAGGIYIYDPNGKFLNDVNTINGYFMNGNEQVTMFYDPQNKMILTAADAINSNGTYYSYDPATGVITAHDQTWSGPLLFEPGGGDGQNQATNGSTTVYIDAEGLTSEQNGSYTMQSIILPDVVSRGAPTPSGVVAYGNGFLVAGAVKNPMLMGIYMNNNLNNVGLFTWNPSNPNSPTEVPDPMFNQKMTGDMPAIIRVDTPSPPTNITATSSPVQVSWYKYSLTLSATPTTLGVGSPTTLKATSTTGGPSVDVIQIVDQTANQIVGTSAANATTFTAPWSPQNPETDTFVAYFKNPSTGAVDQASNTVEVTWQQVQLTLSGAGVYHTPDWLNNLNAYNAANPTNPRPVTEFWAGEEFLFQVKSSATNIASASVTVPALAYSSYAPVGAPNHVSVQLTFDASTGLLTGHTDPNWEPWFQYLNPGTYTATFWVKSGDSQVATVQVPFTVNGNWTDFWKDTQVY